MNLHTNAARATKARRGRLSYQWRPQHESLESRLNLASVYLSYQSTLYSDVGRDVSLIDTGDFDNDSDVDLLGVVNDQTFWFENIGLTSFLPRPLSHISKPCRQSIESLSTFPTFETIDNTGDQVDDVLVADPCRNRILLFTGTSARGLAHSGLQIEASWDIELVDFDADGDDDFVFLERDTLTIRQNDIAELGNLPEQSFEQVSSYVFGDLDNDNDLDLLINGCRIVTNEVGKFVEQNVSIDLPCGYAQELVDVDGDGLDDLVMWEVVMWNWRLGWFKNLGENRFRDFQPIIARRLGSWRLFDIDRDSDLDFVASHGGVGSGNVLD